jgi:hypothetical protein
MGPSLFSAAAALRTAGKELTRSPAEAVSA